MFPGDASIQPGFLYFLVFPHGVEFVFSEKHPFYRIILYNSTESVFYKLENRRKTATLFFFTNR